MRTKILILFLSLIVLNSCKKTGDVEIPGTTPPSAATLTFPAQNSACTTGTVISATQSTIVFSWNTSANTTGYELNVKNLLTGVTTSYLTLNNQLSVDLLRDTPYSWYVASKSTTSSVTTKSDPWKFYNAGLGSSSHPPFPADGLKPTFNQDITATAGVVNLSWTGTDPDNNITSYDVYFGTTANPASFKTGLTDAFTNGVSVTAGTIYYWKVITKDAQGNTSDSGVFQFKVN
jgi:hypothetical protein